MLLHTGTIVAAFPSLVPIKWKLTELGIPKSATEMSKSIAMKDRAWEICHCKTSHNLDGFEGRFLSVHKNFSLFFLL